MHSRAYETASVGFGSKVISETPGCIVFHVLAITYAMVTLFTSSSFRISSLARVLSADSMSWEVSKVALAVLATVSSSALVDIFLRPMDY